MKFYTQEQMVNKHVGAKGTPAREEYDDQMVNDKMVNGVMFKITPPHMAKCCISSFAVYIHALSYSVYVLPSFR